MSKKIMSFGKFKKYCKEIDNLIPPFYLLQIYNSINNKYEKEILNNRVKKSTFYFKKEKIDFYYFNNYKGFYRTKTGNKIYNSVFGLFFQNNEFYYFSYSGKSLSPISMYTEIVENNMYIDELKFKEHLNDQIKKVEGKVLKTVRTIFDRYSWSLLDYDDNHDKNKEKLNKTSYIIRILIREIFKNKKNSISVFEKIISSHMDYETLVLSKKISGTNRHYKLIKDTSDKSSIDYINKIYDKYPLLISLAIGGHIDFPNREKEIGRLFYENLKLGNISDFEKHLISFFNLSEKNLDDISKVNWQMATPFKNRPILFIELIKNGIDINKFKSRKSYESLYIMYYYYYFNPFISIGIDECLNCYDLEIEKSHYYIFKKEIINDMKNSTTSVNFHKDEFFQAVEIKDFKRTLFKLLSRNYRIPFFKKDIMINGFQLNISKNNEDFNIEINKDGIVDNLNLYIKHIDKKSIEIEIENNDKFIDLISEIKSIIITDFNRLFNSRYDKLEILDRASFYFYLYEFYKDKRVEQNLYRFFTNYYAFTKHNKNKILELSPLNKKSYKVDNYDVEYTSLIDSI